MDFINEHRKAITALVTGLIGWAVAYNVADDQWVALATVVAVALGVYAIPNRPANG